MISSHIYFIRPVGKRGPVKIGRSDMPRERLANYMRWSPFHLEIVAIIRGDFDLEGQIHKCLAKSHSHGEWFRPTKTVVTFVEKIIAGVPVEQAIDLDKPQGTIRKSSSKKRAAWFREHGVAA